VGCAGSSARPEVPATGRQSATPSIGATAASEAASATDGAVPEQSVRPGVNAKYFEPGAARTWTEVFEGESREVFRHRDAIVAALGLARGMAVGDIGAGTGLFTVPLARAVGPEGQVYAVDIVPAFLERVAMRAQKAGATQVTTVLGEERRTGLSPASLDLAFLCNVYHHIEYPHSYMTSVLEALRPGGRLVVVDFERIEGVTKKSMLLHVRAPKETVIEEILGAGFELLGEEDFLKQNYFLTFWRPPEGHKP